MWSFDPCTPLKRRLIFPQSIYYTDGKKSDAKKHSEGTTERLDHGSQEESMGIRIKCVKKSRGHPKQKVDAPKIKRC